MKRPTIETFLNDYLRSVVLYGSGTLEMTERKWYNPMRWIYGKYKMSVYSPENMYKGQTRNHYAAPER